jgi:SAM-dependent methyltransferase
VTDRVKLYQRLPATADVTWWRDLAARAPGGRVLYLGCGTGRLAVPMAAASVNLVAVDVDRDMLDALATRVEEVGDLAGRVRLVESPAHQIDLGDRFGLVVLPSSLVNGMTDPGERTEAVRRAAAHCRRDGQVVLQVLNPYWMTCDDPSARGTIDPADGSEPIQVAIRSDDVDVWEQRVRASITYRFADGQRLVDDIDAVALYPRELRALAFQAGLQIAERWGARPGVDPLTTAGGTWHLVCRPLDA